MKASKFPVTYNGEQFRVSVAEGKYDNHGEPTHTVKVYVKRSGPFASIAPFRKVRTFTVPSVKRHIDDVIRSAEIAVKSYVRERNALRTVREDVPKTDARVEKAWRKFAEWDGEVGG